MWLEFLVSNKPGQDWIEMFVCLGGDLLHNTVKTEGADFRQMHILCQMWSI